jgi:ERCC4-type nuclease
VPESHHGRSSQAIPVQGIPWDGLPNPSRAGDPERPLKTYRVVADSREQNPLPIPGFLEILDPHNLPTKKASTVVKVEVVRRALKAADYVLEGNGGVVYTADASKGAAVVERKYSVDEVGENLFNPTRRPAFIRLLTRMRESWSHPILLIEGGLSTLFRQGLHHPPGLVIDGLQRLTMEYGVPIQLTGDGRGLTQRQHLGEYVTRYLINGSLRGGAIMPGTSGVPAHAEPA